MAEKAKKTKATTKKNLLYVLWVVALVAVMATAIVLVSVISGGRSDNLLDNSGSGGGASVEQPSSSDKTPDGGNSGDDGNDSGNTPDTGDGNGDNQGSTPQPDVPVINKITFIMPCENATVIKRYTADTVVFNSTLGAYMGHLAIDFAADEGTEVRCVYDGVVESITTSYLTGTTVTVDHGNNLKTVYNSIVANDALYEGAEVSQGDVLGSVSSNNLQEYKDGPHLHFEVFKGGERIDPEEYLIGEEK